MCLNTAQDAQFFGWRFNGSVNDRIVHLGRHMFVKSAQDPGQFSFCVFCGPLPTACRVQPQDVPKQHWTQVLGV
jgi:hypothetical protein